MEKKNVVSIEDRIPKLKQARKKKANRRLILYLSIFFFLITIIVYLQSPLSHVKTIVINGNIILDDTEIMNESGLIKNTSIWTINKEKMKTVLEKDPIIQSANVKRKLPWTVEITVKEQRLIGFIKQKNDYYPLLANGSVLKDRNQSIPKGEAPILFSFTEQEQIQKISDELHKLPHDIINLISEIHWEPTKTNKNKIILYMNDGYTVSGTMRDFADKMQLYPSIVSQLDPKKTGIIHIGVGTYFEEYADKEKEDKKNE